MKAKFRVTVTNDDGTVARWADSELQLATAIAGLDPSSAKQDFLTQAESLMRTIAENQLPALYQAVLEAPKTDLEAAFEAAEAKERLQAKLKSERERKAGAPAAEDTGDEASEEEKGKQDEQ